MTGEKVGLNEKALDAAIVVGSNMAGEHLVRQIVTEYLTVARSAAAAEMPGVEEIARAIYESQGFAYEGRTVMADGTPYAEWAKAVRGARAVLDLFAPILAEKERLRASVLDAEQRCAAMDDAAKADWSKHGATEIALGQWKARALAAEAALAEWHPRGSGQNL